MIINYRNFLFLAMSELTFIEKLGLVDINEYRQKKGAKGTYSMVTIFDDQGNLSLDSEFIGAYKNSKDIINIINTIRNGYINASNEAGDTNTTFSKPTVTNNDIQYYDLTIQFIAENKTDDSKVLTVFRVYTYDKEDYENILRNYGVSSKY